MVYSSFKFEQVLDEFYLSIREQDLFKNLTGIEPTQRLTDTLAKGEKFAILTSTEKAKSEFIIAPILLEVTSYYPQQLAIHSGRNLEADSDEGLSGECDFIIGKGSVSTIVNQPIITILRKKEHQSHHDALGQCIAQMYGAMVYNQKHNDHTDKVYGCLTNGETWQFLKLEDELITIDPNVIYLNELERILSCFSAIVSEFL